MSKSKSVASEVVEDGGVTTDSAGRKSYHLVTTLYLPSGERIVQFRPSGRGDDSAGAMQAAADMFKVEEVLAVEVNRLDFLTTGKIKVRIAWRRSSQQCETCGANHTSPRKDCDDPKGCGHYKSNPKVVQAHGKLNEADHLKKLQAHLNNKGK